MTKRYDENSPGYLAGYNAALERARARIEHMRGEVRGLSNILMTMLHACHGVAVTAPQRGFVEDVDWLRRNRDAIRDMAKIMLDGLREAGATRDWGVVDATLTTIEAYIQEHGDDRRGGNGQGLSQEA